MTMLMLLWVEYDESHVLSFTFGLGAALAVVLLVVIQLLMNKSALHIWNLMLVTVLAGAAALLPGNPLFTNAGSFLWGVGDGLGYVIILYMLGCAIKRSRSHRMFRLCCIVAFVEYFVITGVFDIAYENLDYPNHYIAFAVVLGLCLICFGLSPVLQRRLFHADWTDALHGMDALRDEHGETLNAVESIDRTAELGLTPRETQVFTLLLTEVSPKQIAAELKISYASVNFHTKNLYRKLNIQSRTELFALYSSYANPKNSPRSD
jgi:DNA-binding CsgD family transcriptional regulator